MVVIRDEKRIARLKMVSQWLSLIGMLALIIGLIMAFVGLNDVTSLAFYQMLALIVGWIFSQIGIYLAHRYVRQPRPDQILDETLQKVARNGRLYHYVLPAPHVLLTPTGIMIFVTKYQGGKIKAEGKNWKQSGIGLRRFFGQEGIGNPGREAEILVSSLANYIRKHAPEVEEVLIAPLIVFTNKRGAELDVKKSAVPAMHYSKLKGFLRQQRKSETPPMSEADYEALKVAFDKKAPYLPNID